MSFNPPNSACCYLTEDSEASLLKEFLLSIGTGKAPLSSAGPLAVHIVCAHIPTHSCSLFLGDHFTAFFFSEKVFTLRNGKKCTQRGDEGGRKKVWTCPL